MSIELVPLLAGKPPDLGTAWVARGVVARLSRILAGGALLTGVRRFREKTAKRFRSRTSEKIR
jgi:hypothetical protein